MKKYLLLLILISLSVICTLAALEWPVPVPHPVSLFGQRGNGIIECGISLKNTETVHATGHGTVLITIGESESMQGFPSTLGNALIIAHEDGLLTVYGNLRSLEQVASTQEIEAGTMIGEAGETGWGLKGGIYFEVIDQINKTVLNPLLLLPLLPDSKAPVIRSVSVVSESGQQYAIGQTKFLKQGSYRLYSDIIDTLDVSQTELSPFRVTILLNGKESLSVPFETIKQNAGSVFLAREELTKEMLYSDPERMYLGDLTLTRGKTELTLIARDITGNERSQQFTIQIE